MPAELPLLSSSTATLSIEPTTPTGGSGTLSVLQQHVINAQACPCNTCPTKQDCRSECTRFKRNIRTGKV